MKTLIIEDDAETAAFIAAGLRSRGHEPMLAGDGREGFEIAAHETFDVIILDRMLPELDGLVRCRSDPRGRRIDPGAVPDKPVGT